MKKHTLLFLGLFSSLLQTNAQSGSTLYGVVRKNYYSMVQTPLDSNWIEQLDSSTVRLGELNLNTGVVNNIGNKSYKESVNLTGAALNPFDNSFVFIGANAINTFSLNTGLLVSNPQLNNPIAQSYFDNFRFNHSDSILYGLARRIIYNPTTMSYTGQVFLSKVNTISGVITQISPSSVAQGFALAGSAIDPFQMVYYFSTGSRLLGLDLYNGIVFSNVAIQIPNGGIFDNFTYSCVDNTLYGLVRRNYFSYKPNPLFPSDSIEELDSSTVRLAKINPSNGQVTIISPSAVTQGGYSLNAGSAVDPNSFTFFYNPGGRIIGVSLITGLKTIDQPLSFANGDYFDLMRNFENCKTASAKRLSSGEILSTPNKSAKIDFTLYPNPSSEFVEINSSEQLSSISLFDIKGQSLLSVQPQSSKYKLAVFNLLPGIYFVECKGKSGSSNIQKLIRIP